MKRKLGFELVKLYYNEDVANQAIEEFDKIFIKKEIPDDIPEITLNEKDVKLINLIVNNKLADSNGSARRLIEQGGVTINGAKVSDVNYVIEQKKEFTLKVGKRKFLKVKIN